MSHHSRRGLWLSITYTSLGVTAQCTECLKVTRQLVYTSALLLALYRFVLLHQQAAAA